MNDIRIEKIRSNNKEKMAATNARSDIYPIRTIQYPYGQSGKYTWNTFDKTFTNTKISNAYGKISPSYNYNY
jgi:hypothetical protein